MGEFSFIKLILFLLGVGGLSLGMLGDLGDRLPIISNLLPSGTPAVQIPGVELSRTIPMGLRGDRYSIASSERPRFLEAVFDPFDPRVGETQKLTVKLISDEPIQSVSVNLNTDTATTTYDLKLGERKGAEEIWEVSWDVSDTHDKVYTAVLRGESAESKSRIDLNFK